MDQSRAHEAVAWTKQRLDELDAIITQVEASVDGLAEGAGKQVQAATVRLQQSRVRIQGFYDGLRKEADAVRKGADELQEQIEKEWLEVESAFHAFLSEARDEVETVRRALATRVQAQRRSWDNSLANLRDRAQQAVEKARGELDAAQDRLSDEFEKLQGRIGDTRIAGGESWDAVKSGLVEAREVQDRTIGKIKDSFSRLS